VIPIDHEYGHSASTLRSWPSSTTALAPTSAMNRCSWERMRRATCFRGAARTARASHGQPRGNRSSTSGGASAPGEARRADQDFHDVLEKMHVLDRAQPDEDRQDRWCCRSHRDSFPPTRKGPHRCLQTHGFRGHVLRKRDLHDYDPSLAQIASPRWGVLGSQQYFPTQYESLPGAVKVAGAALLGCTAEASGIMSFTTGLNFLQLSGNHFPTWRGRRPLHVLEHACYELLPGTPTPPDRLQKD
jgi:hypothetical protein